MKPYQLIGLPYRLGADPAVHGAADCVSMCRTVLASYNILTPEPKREWYRRLRRGDTSVFKEQLELWGEPTSKMCEGTVGLCESEDGYGLAIWWLGGWLSYTNTELTWKPQDALHPVALYCQRTNN